jgi:glutamyl endopeptidase
MSDETESTGTGEGAPGEGATAAPAKAEKGAEGGAADTSLDARVASPATEAEGANESTGTPFDELRARPAHLAAGEPEVIIGVDERVRIADTTLFPWRAICSLRIRASDGTSWIGTGWFVSPRVVVTAGHCVFMKDHGGWAKSIEVIPGRNESRMPFGSVSSKRLGSVRGWVENTLTEYDYGVIVLPASSALGAQVGHFGIVNQDDAALANVKLNLSGYPGDKDTGTQWWHAKEAQKLEPRLIHYEIDTMGGQSGAPVWRGLDGGRFVVGIHTTGLADGNHATRIESNVYANLSAWITENA